MKHVGKYGEKPCVVIYREVPNEPENCLIVLTEQLSDSNHDSLMDVVQSNEGQESNNISDVLHRRQFVDGANMLSSLHYGKFIRKVPVSQVSLTPVPNQSIPLAEVNAELRKIEGGYVPPVNDESHLNDKPRTTASTVQQPADGNSEEIAASLLTQAELLEADAKSLLADAKARRAEAKKLQGNKASKKADSE